MTDAGGLKPENIKAIVFDLDDTLYPQIEWKKSGFGAIAELLARRAGIDRDEVLKSLDDILAEHGPSHPGMFDLLLERMGPVGVSVGTLVEAFRSHKPVLKPYPGVKELLEMLAGRFRLGLLTDGLVGSQRAKVAGLGIGRFFEKIVYSDELGLEKPDQRLFEIFEDEFSLPGEALAYVGDNPAKDFIGANARGWFTVRVLTGEHARESALPGHEARLRLDGLKDL